MVDLSVQVSPVCGDELARHLGEFKPFVQHLQGIGKNPLSSLQRMDAIGDQQVVQECHLPFEGQALPHVRIAAESQVGVECAQFQSK